MKEEMMQRGFVSSCVLISVAAMLGCAGSQSAPETSSRQYLRLSKLYLDLPHAGAFINYNPALSVVLMRKIDTYEPEEAVRAIETRSDTSAPDVYVIDFNQGPSGDPHFIFNRKDRQNLVRVAELSGTELTIPGDGSVLVSGLANDYFDRVRKYVLGEGTIKEVRQPFYYVGITTTNTTPLNLYADMDKDDIVEHLPTGSVIEVLLARAKYREETDEDGSRHQNFTGYDFLAKSPNGLLGWTREGGLCGEEALKGICYHGD